ncbi:hypothetical protein TCAL_16476 [Tigriopus californicus]|uniref:Uncharacterized protein n=1 Tax=Tigriopus californicus TaxID=6832 RepID=A0A553NS24_TIGCA|nr:hypothetical protein TCAL_16476 [Tigriopus californicus]
MGLVSMTMTVPMTVSMTSLRPARLIQYEDHKHHHSHVMTRAVRAFDDAGRTMSLVSMTMTVPMTVSMTSLRPARLIQYEDHKHHHSHVMTRAVRAFDDAGRTMGLVSMTMTVPMPMSMPSLYPASLIQY